MSIVRTDPFRDGGTLRAMRLHGVILGFVLCAVCAMGGVTGNHIIPRVVVPELDNVIANLELMPLKMNEGKNAKIGARQVALARKLHKAGLLGAQGLAAVERKGK